MTRHSQVQLVATKRNVGNGDFYSLRCNDVEWAQLRFVEDEGWKIWALDKGLRKVLSPKVYRLRNNQSVKIVLNACRRGYLEFFYKDITWHAALAEKRRAKKNN